MTTILGISAFYHDSAAALIQDGEIVAAAQEERFTRKKHDHSFPKEAIQYCLGEAGVTEEQLDYVGFYDKPLLKFDRLLETYVSYAPLGFRSFMRAMPLWLKQKLHIPREIHKGLGGKYKKRFVFTEHHESHAASAFFPSPFDEAAILTLDGVGEWATASLGIGSGNKIGLTRQIRFPHSLGLLYSAFTYYCGFKVNSGEYKLMGLAPYGRPRYRDLILENIVDLKADGSFRMDMSYFNYGPGLTMTSSKFHELFGGPPRSSESGLDDRFMDIASSIQAVTEEIMLRMARFAHEQTGMKHLVLAGGVALNCVGNGRLLRESPFDDIWIQPAAGDAGGALGTAMFIWHQLLDNPRRTNPRDSQSGSLLGPQFNEAEIREALDDRGAVYKEMEEAELIDVIAGCIAEGKVIGHMQGRMEFGPRALGNRSIIGDARSLEMQTVMNLKIKFRESFRPFAPAVMQDHVHKWFDMKEKQPSPYMLLVADVLPSVRTSSAPEDKKGLDLLKQGRSKVPAITHVDYSARVQTVDSERHPRFYSIVERFYEMTGCPVVINTSFNVRGEPIVCTPEDAYRCFIGTNMDVLVIENFVLMKSDQPNASEVTADDYAAEFELD